MPVFDTAPSEIFFDSYTDSFIRGVMVAPSRSSDILFYVTGSRGRVGSAVSGGNLLSGINNVSEYLRYSYLSQSQYQKTQRIVQLASSQYQYYDTFLPDIDQIFKVDNSLPILLRDSNPAYNGLLYVYLFGVSVPSGSIYGPSSILTLTSSDDPNIKLSNNTWIPSFPYQYKYRNVERKRFPSTISTIKTKASASFAKNTSPYNVAGTSSIEQFVNFSLVANTADPFWGGVGGTATVNQLYPIPGFILSGNMDSKLLESNLYPLATSCSQSLIGLGVDARNVTSIAGLFNASTFANITGPDFTDFAKFFYGFGDILKLPNYVEVGWFVASNPTRYLAGVTVRGWKYGMLSGTPINPKYIFSRNRHGHLRDMLEPSLKTKLSELSTGTIFSSPIRITFISSSLWWENEAWVTASNPALNTRDCGYYNFEGRVGRPFSDS